MRLGEAPPPGSLDPIETASRDEIAALQTKRLKATLRARLREGAGLSREIRGGGRSSG